MQVARRTQFDSLSTLLQAGGRKRTAAGLPADVGWMGLGIELSLGLVNLP